MHINGKDCSTIEHHGETEHLYHHRSHLFMDAMAFDIDHKIHHHWVSYVQEHGFHSNRCILMNDIEDPVGETERPQSQSSPVLPPQSEIHRQHPEENISVTQLHYTFMHDPHAPPQRSGRQQVCYDPHSHRGYHWIMYRSTYFQIYKGYARHQATQLHCWVVKHGFTKSILQSDAETSLTQVVNTVATDLNLPTRVSPPYSHQLQGKVERLHNDYLVHSSGKTLHFENYRYNYRSSIVGFGECVLGDTCNILTQKSRLRNQHQKLRGIWFGRDLVTTSTSLHCLSCTANIHQQPVELTDAGKSLVHPQKPSIFERFTSTGLSSVMTSTSRQESTSATSRSRTSLLEIYNCKNLAPPQEQHPAQHQIPPPPGIPQSPQAFSTSSTHVQTKSSIWQHNRFKDHLRKCRQHQHLAPQAVHRPAGKPTINLIPLHVNTHRDSDWAMDIE